MEGLRPKDDHGAFYVNVTLDQHADLCMYACMLSPVRLFVTPWTVAHQVLQSMGCSGQEYLSGLPFPLQGIFLSQGLNLHLSHLLHWRVDSLPPHHVGSLVKHSALASVCALSLQIEYAATRWQ